MNNHDRREDELDRLLAAGRTDVDAVAALLARARAVLPETPDDTTASRHVAAAAAATEQREGVAAVAASPTWRARRGRVAQVLGYTTTKVALGVGIAAAATGGLAATDSLPDPVQRAVSNGASYVGVDFPYPEDRLAELDTPVEELPSPDTGIPVEQPADDRSESTRGAEVDPPADADAPVDAPPADDRRGPVTDPPPPPADPPAGEEDRPAPPVDAPPVEPPSRSDSTGAGAAETDERPG